MSDDRPWWLEAWPDERVQIYPLPWTDLLVPDARNDEMKRAKDARERGCAKLSHSPPSRNR